MERRDATSLGSISRWCIPRVVEGGRGIMERIVTTAIVGTEQIQLQEASTGTPVDALAAQLVGEQERKLLLTAGAWSIYRRAGYCARANIDGFNPVQALSGKDIGSRSHPGEKVHTPNPNESSEDALAPCSPRATHLLSMLLLQHQYKPLLPEALARMQQAQLRIPHALLPLVLTHSTQDKNARAPLLPVLGKRGQWLSRFNPAWSWVTDSLKDAEDLQLDAAKIIWQEGTSEQRRALFQRLRAAEPARARAWLMDVWPQEKATNKGNFLATLNINLSAEDEPFLEQALGDRSSSVRGTAAELLANITTSALSQRMRARAETLLNYTHGTLTVTPPHTLELAWQKDGIVVEPPKHVGERAFWLGQVLAKVPPQHWAQLFGVSPAQLIAAAKENEWEATLIAGWLHATTLYKQQQWAQALWERWLQQSSDTPPPFDTSLATQLLSMLPQQDIENAILQLTPNAAGWSPALTALPCAWSHQFGERYLQLLREYIRSSQAHSNQYYHWVQSVNLAAIALSPSNFDLALVPWELPASPAWYGKLCKEAITTLTTLIEMRKRIIEEIN